RPGCVARARTAAYEAPARVVQWWLCECTRQRPSRRLHSGTLTGTRARCGNLDLLSRFWVVRGRGGAAGAGGLMGLLVGLGRAVGGEGGQVDGGVAEAGPDRVGGPDR